MKQLMTLLQIAFIGIIVCPRIASANSNPEIYSANNLINRIEGIVWSPDRRPVRDLYVELQNENYFAVARTRTDSSGRFSFSGVSFGRYNVKVLTSGTNYLEYTESVDLVNVLRGAGDTVYLEIYLKFDKRKINSGLSEITEAIFVQDVPEEARKLYKKGVKDLHEKGDTGFTEIEEALKIFPTYFDALNSLGCEYVARKEYEKSLAYLIRAIDVNQRSFSSFYALAYACYQLNHRPEALEAARGATMLQPKSLNAQLLYGTLLRLDRSYEKAEEVLLQAKKLSKDKPVAEVHWQLALLYNKLGRNKEAADELEDYLKIRPDARDEKEIQELIAKLRRNSKHKFVSMIK
ncbi:MAG TPA: carboxypeptidase regulatory-like domain-containing protein [Pyrinomonadaceae bacterium]|jgi:tetratricopeptide (TPR) repeat protein